MTATAFPRPNLRRGPKAVKIPVALETAEQTAFVVWFRKAHKNVLIHSIPNGTHLAGSDKQKGRQMDRLKAEGLVAGMPDLHIPEWGIWIEMKRQKLSRLSADQIAIHAHLRAVGQIVIVAFGWDDARAKMQAVLDASEVRA